MHDDYISILQAAVDGRKVEVRGFDGPNSTGWVKLSLEGTVRKILRGVSPSSFRIDGKITQEEATEALSKLRRFNGDNEAYAILHQFIEQK